MTHRYFIDAPLEKGDTVELSKEEIKHLKKVMRTRVGTEIELINGKGVLAKANFDETIIIHESTHFPIPNPKELALALTEPKVLDLAVEKGTELGITTFYIFPSTKSKLSSLSESKRARVQKILVSALKQSKRLHLPQVCYLKNKEELPKNKEYLLADFDGMGISEIKNSSYTFLIGPESGFTVDEISFFKENLEAKGILLSDGVLRAETAAIAAAVLLNI